MPSPKRILIHYTHKETLGHTTRTAALVSAITRNYAGKAEVLVLQGGVHQPYVQHSDLARIVDIPYPFDTRDSFRAPSANRQTAARAAFVLDTAQTFKPDVFITEFFPFGRSAYTAELLPVLGYLRRSKARIMASIGYPFIIDLIHLHEPAFANVFNTLLRLYDTFLIHTPNELETPYFLNSMGAPDLQELYKKTLRTIRTRTVYTGYIVPEKILKPAATPLSATLPSAKNTIIVSRGGGAVYPKLIIHAIRAQKLLGKDFRTIIACGPSTTAKEKLLFQTCLNKERPRQLLLADHLPDLDDHLATCQVSVSLTGYNTSVQLMRHGTPSVLVPYQNFRSSMPTNDQLARACLLQEHFGSLRLEHDTLTPKSLTEAIRQRAAMPRPKPGPKAWFSGAAASARIIVEGI